MRNHPIFLLAVVLLLSNPARAVEFFWPSGSPLSACGNTLQNCVNQAEPGRGDIVTIVDDFQGGSLDGLTFINENITINRDLILRAASTVEAIFTGGFSLTMELSPNQTGALYDLTFTNGRVLLRHQGSNQGFATYIAERLRFRAFTATATLLACAIEARSDELLPVGAIGTFGRFVIRMNEINLATSAVRPAGICVLGNRLAGSAAPSDISMNRIVSSNTTSDGVLSAIDSGAVDIRRNRFTGIGRSINSTQNFANATVEQIISHNVMTGFSSGINVGIGNGNAIVANNTLVCASGSSVGTGINTPNTFLPAAQVRLVNNLISECPEGIRAVPSTSSNSNNLVFNATSAFLLTTPGPGTLTSNPQFESAGYFRPAPTSPAINAGTPVSEAVGFDVEGNRQPSSQPDIGAYELVSDRGVQEMFAGGAISEPFALANLFLQVDDRPIATPLGGLAFSAVQLEQPHSMWFSTNSWLLRFGAPDEPLAAGRRFNVMAPRENHARFLHTATDMGLSVTELDHPAVNNQPNAIIIVNERFDRASGNGQDGNPLSVYYSNSTNRWNISNENLAIMSVGARFHVMAGNVASGMAFVARVAQSSPSIPLRHPDLDNNPCAVFAVGRRGLIFNPLPLVVEYQPAGTNNPGRWQIQQPSNTPFPTGAEFSVIIDGTASSRCVSAIPNDIFRNGFE